MLTRYPGARGRAALGARGGGIGWLLAYGTTYIPVIHYHPSHSFSSYRIGNFFSETVILRVKKSSTHPTPVTAVRETQVALATRPSRP